MLSADDVRAALLAVNRSDAPFQVRLGQPDEAELISEWRIVDAQWQDLFSDAGLTKVAKVLMKLDPGKREVRSKDQEWSVAWRAGIATVMRDASNSSGQIWTREAAISFGLDRQGQIAKRYGYRFSSTELKEPLRRAVLACGWGWRGIVSAAL